jgi:glycerol kinase
MDIGRRSDANPSLYLLLDVGGHAARAAVCDAAGRQVAIATRSITTRRGVAGEVEHDAAQVLDALRESVADVVSSGQVATEHIVSAGLSCQRASVVAWDRVTGEAFGPVLSWQDSRAAHLLDAATLDAGQVRAITGLRPTPFFGASKLAWMWRHTPTLRRAASQGRLAWGPLASFLLHGLLEQRPYQCSASLAQRTLLFDIHQGEWSEPLCAAFGLPPESLPTPVADLDEYGDLRVDEQCVPLRVCAGDQNLVPLALAAGGAAPGRCAAVNLGTGAFLFAAAGDDGDTASELLASVLPGASGRPRLMQEATVNGAGAAFDWLAQTAAVETLPWAALTADALDAPLFLNTVGGIGSPVWRAASEPRFERPPRDLSEAMCAVADSITFLLALNLDRLREFGTDVERLDVGGGLSRSDGLCQRLADVSGLPLRRMHETELSLSGLHRMLSERSDSVAGGDQCEPGPCARQRRRRYRAWCEAMDV